jgi:hypothetical protein
MADLSKPTRKQSSFVASKSASEAKTDARSIRRPYDAYLYGPGDDDDGEIRDEQTQLAEDARIAREAGVLTAAELGLDEETYRALIGLQFRDITPEDYSTLSTLDDSVTTKGLDPAL